MILLGKKKLLFRLISIEIIPANLLSAFASATNSRKLSLKNIESAEVKIGVFHKGKMIGFIGGTKNSKSVLVIFGYYVQRKFRGNEIGTRLIRRMIQEAIKRNLKGVDIERMTMQTNYLFVRQKKRAQASAKDLLEFSTMPTRGGQFLGRIRFKKMQ